jgi:N utilization substance protein A
MNFEDLLRMIDILHREKDIPKEVLFLGLEDAIATAIRKRLGVGVYGGLPPAPPSGVPAVLAPAGEPETPLAARGRIAPQACTHAFSPTRRAAAPDVLYDEYETRVGSLVNGTVQRFDNDSLVINLGRTEAYLPREERVRGET